METGDFDTVKVKMRSGGRTYPDRPRTFKVSRKLPIRKKSTSQAEHAAIVELAHRQAREIKALHKQVKELVRAKDKAAERFTDEVDTYVRAKSRRARLDVEANVYVQLSTLKEALLHLRRAARCERHYSRRADELTKRDAHIRELKSEVKGAEVKELSSQLKRLRADALQAKLEIARGKQGASHSRAEAEQARRDAAAARDESEGHAKRARLLDHHARSLEAELLRKDGMMDVHSGGQLR
eukprot:6192358-Pleurochrysis_carterae.AAC.2